MARLNKNKKLTGSIQGLVFREVGDINVVQSKPTRVRQTEATKKASSDFGRASSLTKKLSEGLQNIFFSYYDKKMYNRLRGTVYKALLENHSAPKGEKEFWEGDPTLLNNFEFNTASLFSHYARLVITCSATTGKKVTVGVKAFDPKVHIKWPENLGEAELCFLISCYAKDSFKLLKQEVFKKQVSFNSATTENLHYSTPPLPTDCLVLVSVCILFYKEKSIVSKMLSNTKKLHPAKIVEAIKI